MEKTELKSVTLKSLVQQGVVTTISTLRFNQSGYPYVTLLSGSKPNNVYFGKKTAAIVEGTFSEGDSVVEFLKNSNIVQTVNEQGEIRFKLSNSENSNYSSKSELMSVFGVEEKVQNFDMEAFKKQFASIEITTPQA